ncbi:hypothetical protein [Bacillus sp. SG-1]|uniref:hypothetical protein n=1 Tax=Bacillus sp. SG-1 TaxID=161544 RepID=UPI000154368B|nr:hypothetical protein [Bacillus sp. SG-1]EDL65656.1 hypothetical protein BSG1_12316 [Bacillus sp. SG-1]
MLKHFLQNTSTDAQALQHRFSMNSSRLRVLITLGILSALAAIFQSAGGFFPGPGYLVSPLATAPMILAAVISPGYGAISYLAAIGVLMIWQPSEVVIFTFTTGILGIVTGLAFHKFKNRLMIIFSGGCALFGGIVIILYGFDFPLLGPGISSDFQWLAVILIALFSMIYSWVWTEASIWFFRIFKRIL